MTLSRVPLRASPPECTGGCTRPRYGGTSGLRTAACGRHAARSRRRLPWPRMASPRRALLTGAVPVVGLAGPVPLWGGHARERAAQPVFRKSHTCPVGTAGAEGPPVGGYNDPQDLTPGFPGPGVSPSSPSSQPRAQFRPATGLTELWLSTCQKSVESVANWVCNKPGYTRCMRRMPSACALAHTCMYLPVHVHVHLHLRVHARACALAHVHAHAHPHMHAHEST